MAVSAEKIPEESGTRLKSASQKKTAGEGMTGWEDLRPEAVRQLKLQGIAHGSARMEHMDTIQQIANENPQPRYTAPLKTSRSAGTNRTGLSDSLKAGIESLSGYSMDDVKVHFNSSQPSTIQAHAYAQGTNIYVAPGQEKHVPHEAWHVVQQKQGRVKPTLQMKGNIPVNDEVSLEREADLMGSKAAQAGVSDSGSPVLQGQFVSGDVVQRIEGAPNSAGTDVTLPGTAKSLAGAAEKIADYFGKRARTRAGREEKASALGANNAGNYRIVANYTHRADVDIAGRGVDGDEPGDWGEDEGEGDAASLEVWMELSEEGGGYAKRVRITVNNEVTMDRVMNEPQGTDFQQDLKTDRHPGGGQLGGNERYSSQHTTHAGDAGALSILGNDERQADNLTKVTAEGARFGWLAKGLAHGQYGNTSTGILETDITMAHEGVFTVNPTFRQLWGAWDTVFERQYMKTQKVAVAILKQRLLAGWKSPAVGEADEGMAPLASGDTANGQVTSLLRRNRSLALVPVREDDQPNGAQIVSRLGIKWKSDR